MGRMTKEGEANTSPEEMTIYEVGYLIVPTVPEDDIGSKVALLRDAIEKSGMILSENAPEMRVLAYEMTKELGGKKRRFHKAYFGAIVFQAPARDISRIKKDIEGKDEVLRSLFIKRTRESLAAATAPAARQKSVPTEKKKEVNNEEIDNAIEELVAEE